jgi:hypothetical protein
MNPFHDLSENGFAEMHESILGNKNRKENERKKALPIFKSITLGFQHICPCPSMLRKALSRVTG